MNNIAILIADDEELERWALQKIINEMNISGLELYEAKNGREVIEQIQCTKIHIVLLDIKMPGLDGVSIAKQLKIVSPKTHVVFVTAFSEFDYAREAIRLGVNEYLVKPVSSDIVKSTIENILTRINDEINEQNSSDFADNFLQQELESAIGRGDITNDKIDKYTNIKKIEYIYRYLIATKIVADPTKNKKIIENDCKKVKKVFKTSIIGNQAFLITSEINFTYEMYSLALFSKEYNADELYKKLLLLTEQIRTHLGIKTYFVAIQWKYGEIRELLKEMHTYIALPNTVYPVLVFNQEKSLSLENPRGKIAKIVEYLQQHLAQNVSLDDAARVVGLSPFHVSHLFKVYYGETFIQVYSKLRIEVAKKLLIEGHHSIKDVAYMLGFSDQAYFSRVFKKIEGLSPQSFLANVKK